MRKKLVKNLKYILFWIEVKFTILLVYISIALRNTELAVLRNASEEMLEKQKQIQRRRHHNKVLEKFYAGQKDEKYVQDYYELLKKADKFIRTASPYKMAVAADRHGMMYGQKDKYGRRYEHFGFFDAKHKHSGKTLGEVLEAEMVERKTNDDNFPILYIFNNKPIDVGFAKILDVVKETEKGYLFDDINEISKKFEFPIKVYRENDNCVNKIEQLASYLHVKEIGFDYRQLEFFIPLKFKTNQYDENSQVFKDLINIKNVYVTGMYGELIGFGELKFSKRITHLDLYDVIKFDGIQMEKIN